jgi:hypothetical protein
VFGDGIFHRGRWRGICFCFPRDGGWCFGVVVVIVVVTVVIIIIIICAVAIIIIIIIREQCRWVIEEILRSILGNV